MSKKKNTLKDLDEFLKQQAATLVSPPRLNEKAETATPELKPSSPVAEHQEAQHVPAQELSHQRVISAGSIAKDVTQLALVNGTEFSEEFCNIFLTAMEKRTDFTPEEKILVNTALYLKHGTDWKEAIRQFWKNRKS